MYLPSGRKISMKKIVFILFIGVVFSAHGQQQRKKKQPHDLPAKSRTLATPGTVNFNAPLYMIGDKEISSDEVAKINVDDIESIAVLKDSASTKVYGEKGKRGVVLIAMKKKRKTLN
jgi:TonB-dependent SusC/RagA subfamily outer membrane receptor